MYKRQYLLKVLIRGAAILAIPQIVFLVVIGHFFPSKSLWTWFFRVTAECAVWIGFLAGLAQLFGSSLPEWIGWDVLQILSAFEITTRRTLDSVQDKLPVIDRHLERSENHEVWNHLKQGHPVLIEGEGGSGKSGIAAAIVRQANNQGTPTLFLDTRNYSSTVSTFGHLEKYVGVKLPLRDCLAKLARHMDGCLLVIDQLDSAVGTPACQVSTELLAAAKTLHHVKVVAASCTFEAAECQAIRDLAFDVVRSNPLDKQRVIALLREMGVTKPSKALVALSENLLNLSLVVELLALGVDVSRLDGEIVLWEKYLTTLKEIEGAKTVQAAIDWAYETLDAGKMDFPLPRIQERALQRLQSRCIIITTDHNLYRFRHEQLLYYLYAQAAIEREVQPVNILTRMSGRRAEGALVWILRLYYHRQSPKLTRYLREALTGTVRLDFYEKAALLDEIQTWPDIAAYPAAVEVILEALSMDTSLERYFFRHLAARENPAWFEPLRQQGLFDAPPEPVEREGAISYPRWPAVWYLSAVAPELPEKVIEVAEQIRTRNLFIMLDLVHVAQNMSPEYGARMVPLIVRWADEGMQVEKSVVSLAGYLAQGDQWEAALTLADLILSPKEQSPLLSHRAVSRADRYLVQMFVERHLAFLSKHRPLEMLNIVQRNLERAIEIEERDGRDSSWIRRAAIEPHEQNIGLGEIKELLVDPAVQALSSVVRNMPERGRTVLETYLAHRYSIFRRLAIHTIRMNTDLWPDLVERLFTDQQYLEDIAVYHEYWMLMHDAYESLPASVQNSFVERLLNRPPRERYLVLNQLWAIKDFLPSDEHRRVLAELVNDCGEPDHPSFLSYSRTMAGSRSPKTPEELSNLSPEDVLAELTKELPSHAFNEPTQEGLADALKTAVASTPQHFAPIAPELLGPNIPPIYTHRALWGFREAWTAGKSFDWEPVLEFCDKVSRTSEETPDYDSARSAVADLLEVGVVREDNAIPHRFLDRVRGILLILANDPNPSPEYERKRGIEQPSGILGLAPNVTRGKAVEGLIWHALHVAQISVQEQEAEKRSFPPGSRIEEVVRDKLTEKLDKDKQADPSLAVHSFFGTYLPSLHYLDREWLVSHLEDIFPRRPEMSAYWEAAWDGYLFRSDFFEYLGYLYEILRPYYRYAIEQIALGAQGKAGSDFSRTRLARHLALLYWHGIETLEDDDFLLPLFFDSAPDEIRAGFVVGLGAELGEVKPSADSKEWLRVKALWETRVREIGEIVERKGDLTGFTRELGAFADWVPFIPEDLGNFYAMIEVSGLASEDGAAIRLLEFLSSVAEDHAAFVVSLLEKLLQQEREPWFLATESNEVRTILEVAMSSGDEQARSAAVRVINLFGERGDERYRDLLKLK